LSSDQQFASRRADFDVAETQWDVHAKTEGESCIVERCSMTKAIPCRKRRHAWHLTQDDSGRTQVGSRTETGYGTEAQLASAKPLSVAQR
jgi:hypothetical protein